MDTSKLFNELVLELYSIPDCEVGGPLHIVLDDNNIRDNDILWCIEECFKNDRWEDDVRALTCKIGGFLLITPWDKRDEIINEAWDYVTNIWRKESAMYY